jgi:DNA-binding NtrC family response regulator
VVGVLKKRILVVDDDTLMRDFLSETLRRAGYTVEVAATGGSAIKKLDEAEFDLVLSDMRMPEVTGLDVLDTVKTKSPDTRVVMMTAYGTIENNLECMRRGAFMYIMKPFTADEIELVVARALEHQQLIVENRQLRSELQDRYGFANMVAKSPKMQEVIDFVKTIAVSRSTALITGESGTGKELIARAIHYNSPRRDGPFIKLNCAALSPELMESELFGHEKGAFTGAIRQNRGRFELAHKGTLLLDEISEMDPALQAKLLRVLQEGEFERVGSGETIRVDVRIVATTNRDLIEQIDKGRFREDLYYRLNVIRIHLPPLRQRTEDIPALVSYFIKKYNDQNAKQVKSVSERVMDMLMAYDWPGNVRELENVIERAIVICKGDQLTEKDFPVEALIDRMRPSRDDQLEAGLTIAEMEKRLILRTLEAYSGNRTAAADVLGISTRTLRNKLTEYGMMGIYKD